MLVEAEWGYGQGKFEVVVVWGKGGRDEGRLFTEGGQICLSAAPELESKRLIVHKRATKILAGFTIRALVSDN